MSDVFNRVFKNRCLRMYAAGNEPVLHLEGLLSAASATSKKQQSSVDDVCNFAFRFDSTYYLKVNAPVISGIKIISGRYLVDVCCILLLTLS